jgi:hypothetical protein
VLAVADCRTAKAATACAMLFEKDCSYRTVRVGSPHTIVTSTMRTSALTNELYVSVLLCAHAHLLLSTLHCTHAQPIAGTGSNRPSKTERRDLVRADAVQLEIDPSVTWSSIGGLGRHVRALKEMVQLPLVYPEVFARFGAEVSYTSLELFVLIVQQILTAADEP